MNYTEFLNYKELHCKFKLKSGKEIYGVVWERKTNDKSEYYFASSNTYNKVKSNAWANSVLESAVCKVNLDDLTMAEPLKGISV